MIKIKPFGHWKAETKAKVKSDNCEIIAQKSLLKEIKSNNAKPGKTGYFVVKNGKATLQAVSNEDGGIDLSRIPFQPLTLNDVEHSTFYTDLLIAKPHFTFSELEDSIRSDTRIIPSDYFNPNKCEVIDITDSEVNAEYANNILINFSNSTKDDSMTTCGYKVSFGCDIDCNKMDERHIIGLMYDTNMNTMIGEIEFLIGVSDSNHLTPENRTDNQLVIQIENAYILPEHRGVGYLKIFSMMIESAVADSFLNDNNVSSFKRRESNTVKLKFQTGDKEDKDGDVDFIRQLEFLFRRSFIDYPGIKLI